ncbi:hypothetical protein J2I47_09135 [Fibrella sp. HMF5335]|uniref:YD repeat-containing protein n=1 Tax=Fibrella rubiginis TaxID=2817060 RepID=A0A939GE72_9BACT|nr:hypothetical protein [Fibrella rubiginis]MBO0936706.1 hypothetical protein [Fibrella rubiginis]
MKRPLLLCFVGLLLLTGCHQEPDLPIIPAACRIGLVEIIRENGKVSRQGYLYNAFGSLTQAYEEDQTGQRSLTRTYTYDTTRYVTAREDKTPGGTVRYAYTYEGSPKRIAKIAPTQGSGDTYEYAYEGEAIKSLTIKDAGGSVREQFTYQPDGKLATRTRPKTTERFVVDPATGYVTSYTHADGVFETFTVDAQGHHLVKTYNEPALSKLTSSTYTYADDRTFYANTQLLFRGIPLTPDGSGKPGLLTGYVLNQFVKNVLTVAERATFRYTYNSSGYALGYASSTGERAKFYYTNCPAP